MAYAEVIGPKHRLWLLIPQQTLLGLTALGQLYLVYQSHYADFVIRPHVFILRDQVWGILLFAINALAIVVIYKRNRLVEK